VFAIQTTTASSAVVVAKASTSIELSSRRAICRCVSGSHGMRRFPLRGASLPAANASSSTGPSYPLKLVGSALPLDMFQSRISPASHARSPALAQPSDARIFPSRLIATEKAGFGSGISRRRFLPFGSQMTRRGRPQCPWKLQRWQAASTSVGPSALAARPETYTGAPCSMPTNPGRFTSDENKAFRPSDVSGASDASAPRRRARSGCVAICR